MGDQVRRLAVFSVRQAKGATIWIRAGNAVVNRDGSINIYLDVLPLDGQLHLRDAALGDPNQAKAVPHG